MKQKHLCSSKPPDRHTAAASYDRRWLAFVDTAWTVEAQQQQAELKLRGFW